jgi:hypothetical protein
MVHVYMKIRLNVKSIYSIFRPKSSRILQHKDNIRAAILFELEKKKKMKESGLESEVRIHFCQKKKKKKKKNLA